MRIEFMWFAFAAFALGCFVVAFISYLKGDFRAGCETPWGKFFVEARERSKERLEKNRRILK